MADILNLQAQPAQQPDPHVPSDATQQSPILFKPTRLLVTMPKEAQPVVSNTTLPMLAHPVGTGWACFRAVERFVDTQSLFCGSTGLQKAAMLAASQVHVFEDLPRKPIVAVFLETSKIAGPLTNRTSFHTSGIFRVDGFDEPSHATCVLVPFGSIMQVKSTHPVLAAILDKVVLKAQIDSQKFGNLQKKFYMSLPIQLLGHAKKITGGTLSPLEHWTRENTEDRLSLQFDRNTPVEHIAGCVQDLYTKPYVKAVHLGPCGLWLSVCLRPREARAQP